MRFNKKKSKVENWQCCLYRKPWAVHEILSFPWPPVVVAHDRTKKSRLLWKSIRLKGRRWNESEYIYCRHLFSWPALCGIFPALFIGQCHCCKYWRLATKQNKLYIVVLFLLGDSPESEFYIPTFRNTLSVPSS